MELPDGYVIPYNEHTASAYEIIIKIIKRCAKKEQVFCEVPSTYQGGGEQMLRIDKLLEINKSVTFYNRKVTPRFLFIIAVIILTILCILFWDKLAPETLFTSNYWKDFI